MIQKTFKIFLALVFLSLSLFVVRFSIHGIPTTLLEALILVTFILFVASGSYRSLRGKSKLGLYLGGAFVLSGLIAAFIDPSKTAALGIWKAYFLDGFLVFTMVLSLDLGDKDKAFYRFLIGGGLISALTGIWLFTLGIKTTDGRLVGLDRLSPNYMAMFLAPILAINLAFLVQTWQKSKELIYVVSALVLGYALYLTLSRGSFIGLLAGVIVILFSLLLKTKFKKLSKALMWTVILLLLASSFWFFRPDFTDHGRKATSSNIRYYIWTTSIEIAQKNPILGIGLNNYQNYFTQFTQGRVNYSEFIAPEALSAHNIYLHIYLTMGIAGILAFLALIFYSKFWHIKNLGASAALVVILVSGLFDTPFFRNDLSILFWIILAAFYLSRVDKAKAR